MSTPPSDRRLRDERGITGSAQFALSQSSPAFRADLDAARAELAALRASGPKPDEAACAKEAELNKSPF